MLGLPKATEVNKQLPKSAIYSKFKMNMTAKDRIDRDISRIYIANEVTASKINLKDGVEIKSFFVMSVLLKRKDFNEKNMIALSKLIMQNIVLVLEYKSEGKIMVCRNGKLLQTEWQPKEKLLLEIKGLNLDMVWNNIIIQIGGLTITSGNTIDEQIDIEEQKNKLQKEIDKLEKLARVEKQPRKKFEMHRQILKLKQEELE